MILNLIILTTLLGAGVHSTEPHTLQSEVPNTQHIIHMPGFENQVWPYHLPVQDFSQSINAGLSLYQQQSSGVVDPNKDQQATQFQAGIVGIANEQIQPSPALVAATVQPSHENAGKVASYPGSLIPFYEDQVTILPLLDEVDSDEEQQVWPPVGIYPPPPPPPARPTYIPPYYPISPLYPKPPHYPQHPLEGLPHLPQYPLLPHPTTQRPPYVTTTPIYPKPGGEDVSVLENYQVISNQGIIKYKLRLSNGLTDYKKISKKQIGKETIYVQNGYYSVPVDPKKNKFNLIHYIADERGYRIRGVQTCSNDYPCKVLSE